MFLKLIISVAILHPIICVANVAPKNYEISFDLTEAAETRQFSGVVKIDFECLEQSSKFLLDCKELEINSYEISGGLKVANVTIGDDDKCEILLEEDLVKGDSYLLTLAFTGRINSEPIGIFEDYYKDNGTTSHFISTNFEFGNAKRAFPCFDDPQYKNTFQIKLKHTRDYSVVGNTLQNSITEGGYILTTFEQIPISVNIDIASFSLYQNLKKTSFPLASVSVYHSPEREVSTFFAYLVAMRRTYTQLLGDISIKDRNYLAVPLTFEGRFDNWGSHVVDETNFLRSLLTSTPMNYQQMLQIYSHQLALNWVEFEVTPRTFDEWWISRGLAKFYEYYVPSNTQLVNQFLSWKQFTTEITQKAFENEVNGDPVHGVKFNERAAAIFNMIQGVMGLENFHQGIQSLVKEFSGKTITSEDLFNALTKHVNDPLPADLSEIFMDWFKIDGYPILKVTKKENSVILTQLLFTNTEDDRSLYIPINYIVGTADQELDFEDTAIVDWLLPDSELTLEDIPADNFVIFNKKQASFYRVLYDEPSFELILDLLLTNSSNVDPVTCAQLIDDYGSLARNGYVEYGDFFRLLEYLKESDGSYYTEWSVAHKQLKFLWHRLRGSPAFDRFETFVRQVTEKRFSDIGLGTDLDWSGTEILELTHHQRLNRQFIGDLACSAGVEACVNETMQFMAKLVSVFF
ncbi:aminopeptidase N-like [Culicoides brevitarsis]|uniref:aminopeptidase N-like n=1 Tax=Culicoides brevitarsis TaxID=469753 RepID=UPI00307C270C